jgi:hypothetical protein
MMEAAPSSALCCVALPKLRASDATLKPAFDKIDEQINTWINKAKLAARRAGFSAALRSRRRWPAARD